MAKRLKAMGWPEYQDAVNGDGRWTGKITLVPERLLQPLRWKKPRMVFVNSMSDLFHEDISTEVIGEIFEVMLGTPQHTYQILTKRPERMKHLVTVNSQSGFRLDPMPDNIWLGVSVENQQAADERIPLLLQTPAAVRFLSCEPLLGPVDLGNLVFTGDYEVGLHWLIIGGESGPHARYMNPEWAIELEDESRSLGIPVFVKQMGSAWAKARSGYRDLKGADPKWWPTELRVREMPTGPGPLTLAAGAGGMEER
jgi:protein gp37